MAKLILDYLVQSAGCYPEKVVCEDSRTQVTYRELLEQSQSGGTAIAGLIGRTKEPIAVFMDKSTECVVTFFSVLNSGNFYSPIDCQMPLERIRIIYEILKPKILITDHAHREIAECFCSSDCQILLYEEMITTTKDEVVLERIHNRITEADPLYVLFTSGSTGVPKGVLLNHRVIINYLEWLEKSFDINEQDVFGNQAPFYFDVSVHDIFGAVYFGAGMVIIPRELFSFPVRLIEYMNEKRISTCLWVPSAMGIVAGFDTFQFVRPEYLRHMMFAGEVLPRKQLDYWVKHLPDLVYANLYGPTETFVCTAHIYTGQEPEGQPLPIGNPILNAEALILSNDHQLAGDGEEGELCLRGSCLATGYYCNEERTRQVFIQNPLHNRYQDLIYCTGDLVRYDESGRLVYLSRKDYQIKHMGYRIELGEVETAANRLKVIGECACGYDSDKQRIVLFYSGEKQSRNILIRQLEELLPQYMIPGKFVYMDQLPHNDNGKIDRKKLQEAV